MTATASVPAGAPTRPSPRRERPSWLRLGAAFGAGIVVALCFPPIDLGLLVLVALVPLLWAWRDARPLHAALYGFAYGVACFGAELPWMRYFGTVAIVPLVGAMAATIALVGAIVAALARKGIASPLLTAATWTFVEALFGRWPLGGFAWCDLGVTLHGVPAARALASLGGVLLVTFVIVAVNGFLLDAVVAVRARRPGAVVLAAGGLVGLLLFTVIADVARYEPTVTGTLRYALLQGDDQELSLAGQNSQLLTPAHLALADRLEGKFDLIVFPESSLDTDPETDVGLRERLTDIAAKHDSYVLVNARTPGTDGQVRNSNLMYTPTGALQGVYSKQHLVPFGEYVPWRDQLSFLPELRQVPYDFQAGDRTKVFKVRNHPVGSVICFESAFGPLVRDFVKQGAQALVVSTSNRSYRRSGNSEQHLAQSQMRAAETGRPVLQASVSGISAVIGPDGTVHQTTGLFEQHIVQGTIETTTGETPYVRFGDWIVALSALALLGATGVYAARSFGRSSGRSFRSRAA
jgi:apolipoprotein N-acyltransferase